jgi:predicted glycogen debranching enzyme
VTITFPSSLRLNDTEWLETDGYGGYSSGRALLIPQRRYHNLLTIAESPPSGRVVLLSALEAYCVTPSGRFPLSSFLYPQGVKHPQGSLFLTDFSLTPWPLYTFHTSDRCLIQQNIVFIKRAQVLLVRWTLVSSPYRENDCYIESRPLLSGSSHHHLPRASQDKEWSSLIEGKVITWLNQTTCDLQCESAGTYHNSSQWHYRVSLAEEQRRGYDFEQDLFSPGIITVPLSPHGTLCFTSSVHRRRATEPFRFQDEETCSALLDEEAEHRVKRSLLHRACESFVVRKDEDSSSLSIVAGYPWFTDWGRDTCIAIRGLCGSTKEYCKAHKVLTAWGETLSDGMIPNVFPDGHSNVLYNSVDASLWYCIAVFDLMKRDHTTPDTTKKFYLDIVNQIIASYSRGTRFRIRLDSDGLLAHGLTGTQLTWMDAKYGETVFTPRIGKAVEIQCLWLNVLFLASEFDASFSAMFESGKKSFLKRFWDQSLGYLKDIVDTPHKNYEEENALRPNQIFAVGGLPLVIVPNDIASLIVSSIESTLMTPHGVRTLTPFSPSYRGFYEGNQFERDSAYHQGTGWIWLLGPFIEAWVRVHGTTAEKKAEAYEKFLKPLIEFAQLNGGYLPELCDGTHPHAFKGAPFQAWSLAEVMRVGVDVLGLDFST